MRQHRNTAEPYRLEKVRMILLENRQDGFKNSVLPVFVNHKSVSLNQRAITARFPN